MDYSDFSEENIKINCPLCDIKNHKYEYHLDFKYNVSNFYVRCDLNPIAEGHILVIPKEHITCIGAYGNDLVNEYKTIDTTIRDYLKNTYGSYAVFEHGFFGQTVFHSHIHYFKFNGNLSDVIPEGTNSVNKLDSIDYLKTIYKKDGGYLYVEINNQMYTVDPKLSKPRFFRDRFAKALGNPELSNWKALRENPELVKYANKMCKDTQNKWQNYNIM